MAAALPRHDPPHPVTPDYRVGQCRVCWLLAYDPRYRAPAGPAATPAARPATCVHFDPEPAEPPGRRTGRSGRVCLCAAQWLYGCAVYGVCVRSEAQSRPGVAACSASCPGYEAEEG